MQAKYLMDIKNIINLVINYTEVFFYTVFIILIPPLVLDNATACSSWELFLRFIQRASILASPSDFLNFRHQNFVFDSSCSHFTSYSSITIPAVYRGILGALLYFIYLSFFLHYSVFSLWNRAIINHGLHMAPRNVTRESVCTCVYFQESSSN